MAILSLLAIVLNILAVMATPFPAQEEEYPEVHPGPGMPSLASLGLTSADLHKMNFEPQPRSLSEMAALEKRGRAICQNYEKFSHNNAVACANYLNSIGSRECIIQGHGGSSLFCYIGNAGIYGNNVGPNGSDQQTCGNVAISAYDIINHCTTTGGYMYKGYEYCNGDGNMIVSVEGIY